MRACLGFALKSLARGDRVRLAVAVLGAFGAMFVVLLHLAFLRAVEHKAAQVYGLFDAPIVMVSDRYQFLYRMDGFPPPRLSQALSQPEVEAVAAVSIDNMGWNAPHTGEESSLILIGIDLEPAFIHDEALRASLGALGAPRRILFDRRSNPDVGAPGLGATGSIGSRPATIVGFYELGLPMYAAATAIVSNADFSYYTGRDHSSVQLGLVRLKPGADVHAALSRLQAALPGDVRVQTRADLMEREARYFVEVKPLGIMLRAGLIIGLIVGAVALFQIMSSQVGSRMHEFAVLRAMGFAGRFVYGIGAWQLALLGLGAFLAAWLAAVPVFGYIEGVSTLVMALDRGLFAGAAALCMVMVLAAAAPLRRAGRADPTALFAG
jgi:putative ABC transport system permease protein